jgi:3-oxoacyl-[acyl-carrier-protein] synthase II
MKKIAVTGMGLITPLGAGKEMNWNRLVDCESGVCYEAPLGVFAARAKDFFLDEKVRQLGMAFIAASEAVSEAGLDNSGYAPERIGIAAGESKHNLFNRSFNIEESLPEVLRRLLNVRGRGFSAAAACATGAVNIIMGCKMIEDGECDAVICGSAETTIHPLYISSFKNMGVLSKHSPSPFDKNRDGFAIGEGAGFLVIEDMKKAVFRGAKAHCELAGFSNGLFTDNILKIQSSCGMERLIKSAVKNETPDFIHMHGTGTKSNDYFESEAVSKSFENAKSVSLCSTKAATGHLLGVSGMAGAVFSVMALKNGIVPPTINFTETDIAFGLDYTPNKAKKKKLMSALSLTFGFGGQGAALYFKKLWQDSIYG